MTEADAPWNATLWAVRSRWEITCFRVVVDAAGRIIRTSVHDFNDAAGSVGFDD